MIFFAITQLPQFFEYHHEYKYDDEGLRKKALGLNINPIPCPIMQHLLTIKNGDITHSEVVLVKNLQLIHCFHETMTSVVPLVISLKEGGDDNSSTHCYWT